MYLSWDTYSDKSIKNTILAVLALYCRFGPRIGIQYKSKYVIYQSKFALKTSRPFLLSYLSKQSDFTILLRYYTLKKWKSLSSCSQYLFLSLSLSFAMPSFTTIFIFFFVSHVPQCVIFLIFWFLKKKLGTSCFPTMISWNIFLKSL